MRPSKNPEKILLSLKMKGPRTAAELAREFSMTSEGMRLHLLKLEENGLISSESKTKGVGRPTIVYRLTPLANQQFPDNHSNLTVQLLESVQRILGEEALQLLVEDKRDRDFNRYSKALEHVEGIEQRLALLTEIRNREGYMAEWERLDEGWLFIENNCPICTAATHCSSFCRSEIENIRKLLGDQLQVERTDHATEGNRRCTYVIH